MSNNWMDEQKKIFKGKGKQWICLDLEKVKNKLLEDNLLNEAKQYLLDIEKAGFAWVRYNSPKIDPDNNKKYASFEVRYKSSKIPQPNTLVYIEDETIKLENFKRLDSITPSDAGLETSIIVNNKKVITNKTSNLKTVKKSVNNKKTVKDKTDKIKTITNSIPESLDPVEWEEFLLSEGFEF